MLILMLLVVPVVTGSVKKKLNINNSVHFFLPLSIINL
jgi:hypothetical protein